MCSIVIGHTITFDHTFKVASNIGYEREDHVWVKQYDSLFLVMNSVGQITTWQFTSSTSMDQVNGILQGVYERSTKQGQPINYIFVDDCCKVRNKLQSVQRVTRTLSKIHPLFQHAMYFRVTSGIPLRWRCWDY